MENQPETWLSAAQVAQRYGISKTTLWRWARGQSFPKATAFTPASVRWAQSDLAAFDAAKARKGGAK